MSEVPLYPCTQLLFRSYAQIPKSKSTRGGRRFINSLTRPVNATEGNRTTRKGTSTQPPRRMEVAMKRLAHYDEPLNLQDRAGRRRRQQQEPPARSHAALRSFVLEPRFQCLPVSSHASYVYTCTIARTRAQWRSQGERIVTTPWCNFRQQSLREIDFSVYNRVLKPLEVDSTPKVKLHSVR